MRSTLLIACVLSLACSKATPTGRKAPDGLPPISGVVAAAPAAPSPAAGGVTLAGKLLERIDANSYSYLRIATSEGEQWAAVTRADVATGAPVTVSGQIMEGFESKTLGRRFERIVFGQLAAAPAPAAAAAPAEAVHEAGQAGTPREHMQAVAAGDVAVPPATGEGATTIAALFADRARLAGQEVVVRAKVVKVTGGVMGKTWLHVQDGSGSASNGDNDLAVTTSDEAKLDDVVTLRGRVGVDRDFGSGYRYVAIVENATLAR